TELQQLSREKELILNSAGEGIFGLDLNSNITFCNPAGAKMLGYELDNELIGKNASSIINVSLLPSSMNDDQPHSYKDETFLRKDDSEFPVEYVVSSIMDGEEIVGYVV
ncbi:PAS domain-containing protein, partial [Pseudomonas sp. 2995-1]|uniref:PAS domain-containing protein n=1 Tax=Pseudomonas sp. 2995-1 TaxID=1712679 RepID=UPI00117A31FB